MRLHLWLWVVSLAACGPVRSRELADTAALSSSPTLAPFGEALARPSEQASFLIDGDLRFVRRPDLRPLLKAQQAENPAPRKGASTLSVVTLNVGLLDARLGGKGAELMVGPELAARRVALGGVLGSLGADVIVVEEAWALTDVERFRTGLASFGYASIGGDAVYGDTSADGLMIAYRPERLALVEGTTRNQPFGEDGVDLVPLGAGVHRGFLTATFQLDGRTSLAVYAVHTSPFPSDWRRRHVQLRQVGLDVAALPTNVVALVAGDMNAGLAYRTDTWVTADGSRVEELFANGAGWALAQHYGRLVDAFVRANGTLDDDVASAVEVEPSAMKRLPYGLQGWCTAERRAVFTGSDCNTLYFRQYAGSEPPARLDHLWIRDLHGRVHVAEARTVFTAPEVDGASGLVEPSDHSGLSTRLMVANP